jgi:hypothetical protein
VKPLVYETLSSWDVNSTPGWPSDSPLALIVRLLLSRDGGGRDEKKTYKWFDKTKAAEDKAWTSRFGSQQKRGFEQPALTGIEARVPARD